MDVKNILSSIMESPSDIPCYILDSLWGDHINQPSDEPKIFTIGLSYVSGEILGETANLRYQGNVCKWALAKSFLKRTCPNLETIERNFQKWDTVSFPGKSNGKGDGSGESIYKAYHQKGGSVVDCLFILEIIWRYTCGGPEDAVDGLSSAGIFLQARSDLIVFNNQLPFSVLEALFNLAFPDHEGSNWNFLKLCIIFFSECMLVTEYSQALESIHLQQKKSETEIENFLDLIRKCHSPSFARQPPADPTKLTEMRRAINVVEAGMVIKPAPDNRSVCSIRYTRGVLEIPKLKITGKSEHLLKNVIKYEMRHHPYDTVIIDYLHFMDGLIKTAKDVDVLLNKKVLQNFYGDSKDVADLFNSITREAPLFPSGFCYHGISEAVNEYCEVPRHRWRASFKRNYCSSPWLIASTGAAVLLIILTLIQTICSIISIIH
ncbi:hypothetical protein Leryth_024838 [Lithospermum erythrorhizon]|nr:hypothetical protein Leryth_024838 [Lithospermum erythrorhizon]